MADLLHHAGVCDDYGALAEDEKVKLLARELASPRPFAAPDAGLEDETVRALTFLESYKEMQRQYGDADEEGDEETNSETHKEIVGSYIISMTAGVSDILEPLILAKQAGVTEIDITPLFETVTDLENAPGILQQLFDLGHLPPTLAAARRARGHDRLLRLEQGCGLFSGELGAL